MTPLIQEASRLASVGGKYDLTDYQWFDATNAAEQYYASKIKLDAMKALASPMPFKNTIICFEIEGRKIFIRVIEDEAPNGELFCTVAAIVLRAYSCCILQTKTRKA